jgi:PAS domain S-box-containing protein
MAEGIKDGGIRGAHADLEAKLRQAEERIKLLEERNRSLEQELRPFHVLADNISDHIYFKDKDGRFLWVNRNMYKLRGMAGREELIGKTSFDIHQQERARQSHEDDMRVLTTGEYILNKLESDQYADGSPMWVLTTKIPLRNPQGEIIGICGISKDSTKMVLAEQVLATEGALRNDLLESIPDGVFFNLGEPQHRERLRQAEPGGHRRQDGLRILLPGSRQGSARGRAAHHGDRRAHHQQAREGQLFGRQRALGLYDQGPAP